MAFKPALPRDGNGNPASGFNRRLEFVDLSVQAMPDVAAEGGDWSVDYQSPDNHVSRVCGLYLVYRGIDEATSGTHEFTVQIVDLSDPDNRRIALFGGAAKANMTLNLTQSQLITPADPEDFSYTPNDYGAFVTALQNIVFGQGIGLRFYYVNGGNVANSGDFICKMVVEHEQVVT